mgnify:CR=1 FL=1
MRTILTLAYSNFNLGDDLFLKILFERYKNDKFILFTMNSAYSDFLSIYKNVKVEYFSRPERGILRFFKWMFKFLHLSNSSKYISLIQTYFLSLRYKNKCDAYLEIGGSIFMQKEVKLSLKDYYNFNLTKIFKSKKIFIIGANFGPILSDNFLNFYKELFPMYTDVCFRDKNSHDLFKDIDSVRYAKDVVFSINLPKIDKEINSVGISLIDMSNRQTLSRYENNYINTISEIVIKAFFDKKKIYLFSFCKLEGDENAILKVLNSLPINIRNEVEVVNYDRDIDTFLYSYCKVESMFATRFHAMILSFMASQKVYPLVYSKKMTNILDDIQFKGAYKKVSDLKPEHSEKMLKEIYENFHFLKNENIKEEFQFLKLDSFLNDE